MVLLTGRVHLLPTLALKPRFCPLLAQVYIYVLTGDLGLYSPTHIKEIIQCIYFHLSIFCCSTFHLYDCYVYCTVLYCYPIIHFTNTSYFIHSPLGNNLNCF